MLKNYFITGIRNASRNKVYSFINIICLSVGMAICVLIWQFVSYEENYDNFHKNGRNLYRMETALYDGKKLVNYLSLLPRLVGPTMKDIFPEVAEYARLFSFGGGLVTYRDVHIRVPNMYMADASFLSMFSFPLVKGNPGTALKSPNEAVISESAAKKLFGDEDPIGNVIQHDRLVKLTYTVTGVFKDVPHNSHLQFDFLFSIHRLLESASLKDGWRHAGFFTYLLLHPQADPKTVVAKIPNFAEKYIGKYLEQYKLTPRYFLMPIHDIYLHSPDPGFNIKSRNIQILYFSSIIAIFILLIAWINYINLSTARSIERAKEVSMRKIAGATRPQLIKQFLLESGLFNAAGVILAILLVKIFTPVFNQVVDVPPSFSLLKKEFFWASLVLLSGAGIVLSGIYPAFVLSSFKPITGLTDKIYGRGSRNRLRKILVVFQLVISIVLITGTVTVYRQLRYMQNQDLGINTHQVILVRGPVTVSPHQSTFTLVYNFFNELMQYPMITSATIGDVPGRDYSSRAGVAREGGSKPIMVKRCWADYDFIDTYQIKLLAGRNFSREFLDTTSNVVILNQSAVKALEFESPEKAVNQFVNINQDDEDEAKLKIIGVIKNYHQKSLREPIQPVIFQLPPHYGSSFHVFRLKPGNIKETISFIKEKWEKAFPGNLFEYIFFDDFFNLQYKVESKFGEIFGSLSILAIFIACIGILGLFAHSTLQRTKEIGIRKVFGANVPGICFLLLKDLLKLLLVSVIIAFPIAYYVFSNLLQAYAYRIGIGLWFFVIPPLILLPVLLFTTVFHVGKAALQNPVKSLRYE